MGIIWKISIQIYPILDNIYEYSQSNKSNESIQKKSNTINYNNYIDSIKGLINKNDLIIINKLLKENNEQILEALDDYSINNNKEKLLTNLNTIINVYRERFEKNNQNSSTKKEEKLIKKSEKIQKNLIEFYLFFIFLKKLLKRNFISIFKFWFYFFIIYWVLYYYFFRI